MSRRTGSRRAHLKDASASLHGQLDQRVSELLESRAGYCEYLQRMHQARQVAEALLDDSDAETIYPGWHQRRIAGALQCDLTDLGQPVIRVDAARIRPRLSPAGVLGALYVLEGSALGAKFIARRVQELGFTAGFGARHLDILAGGGSFARFLALLEDAPLDEAADEDCVGAALGTFRLFDRTFSEAVS
jgi:heme oxygenase (biliverdin-IX-beta and delta-forming)